jgi:hypothetical protein
MPSIAPAVWSAIAASFAALSSLLIMLIQRRALLESARPELVLTGWSRCARGNGDAAHEVISFRMIRNVGRGVAMNLFLNSDSDRARPNATLSTKRIPILAANEELAVNGEILVWWKNVKADANGCRFLPITVTILCRDSRGMRHETQYRLFAVEGPLVGVVDEIAPGVMLSSRRTVTRPVCWLKALGRAQRLCRAMRPKQQRAGAVHKEQKNGQ